MQLFLCEKPSQSRDIGTVLGATKKEDGWLSGPDVAVTWARGHLLSEAEPEHYDARFKNWDLSLLPIIPDTFHKVVTADGRKQFGVIKKLLKRARSVVIATDADREGEVIGREILDACKWCGPVQRLWLSALDEASVRKALSALLPGEQTLPLYHAGRARGIADWLTGMNMTRLYTLRGRELGHDGVISVGRVQTPTLKIVVDRDREIARFVPKPWWQTGVSLTAHDVRFMALWLPPAGYADEEGRCIRPDAAQQACALVQQTGQLTVLGTETRKVTESAPLVFSLSALQQECSRRRGMGAEQVLNIAQALYETHKATTYPRTDCGYLPESMHGDAQTILEALRRSDAQLAELMATHVPDATFRSRVWNDKNITAHHGIIPALKPCDTSGMSDDERFVWQLIVTRYLVQFLPAHIAEKTTVSLGCGDTRFVAKGNVVVAPGWKALYAKDTGDDAPEDDADAASRDASLPRLTQGESCRVLSASVVEKKTTPPSPFTDGTLIAAMTNVARLVTDPRLQAVLKENAGLGTEATRAGTITTLLTRGLLVKKGKQLRATEAGMALCDAVSPVLTDPATTAVWETALDNIAQGKLPAEAFINSLKQQTTELVSAALAAPFSLPVTPTPPCPRCGSPTRRRQGSHGAFFSCSRWSECDGVVSPPAKGSRGKGGKTRGGKGKGKPQLSALSTFTRK
ncbi:DNA topoisomerase III [Klebsiella oxytoca]|uniref:DNA topoisomerase III n=1 Tax=Klebsiella oxytoca TaxID=571 RepID=UPI00384AD372